MIPTPFSDAVELLLEQYVPRPFSARTIETGDGDIECYLRREEGRTFRTERLLLLRFGEARLKSINEIVSLVEGRIRDRFNPRPRFRRYRRPR